jgi:hypothetical protein
MTEKEQLKSYLEKALSFVLGDIKYLMSKNVTISFPYLFLSFAGIDFLGGLEHGFEKSNNRYRTSWFISTWMAKINPRYAFNKEDESKSLGSYLYTFARNGLFHMACVQQSVTVDADEGNRRFHLTYSTQNGTTVFFHATQFADDLLKACDLFINDLLSDDLKAHSAFERLKVYSSSSAAKENSFSIPTLFLHLPSETISTSPTYATGSVLKAERLGTQAPSIGD